MKIFSDFSRSQSKFLAGTKIQLCTEGFYAAFLTLPQFFHYAAQTFNSFPLLSLPSLADSLP